MESEAYQIWLEILQDTVPDDADQDVVADSEIMLMDLLLAYVGGYVEEQVQEIEDPRELWVTIKAMFTDRSGLEKVLALKRLHELKYLEVEKVDDFLQKFSRSRSKCVEVGWEFGNLSEIYYGVLLACALPDDGPLGTLKHLLLDKGEGLKYQDAVEVIHSKGIAMEHAAEPIDKGLILREDKLEKLKRIKGYRCKRMGHYASDCQGLEEENKYPEDGAHLMIDYDLNWNSCSSDGDDL